MRKLVVVLFLLTVAACGPPPCGYDCETEADDAYIEYQAEQGLQDWELEKDAARFDEYMSQPDYRDQYEDVEGP